MQLIWVISLMAILAFVIIALLVACECALVRAGFLARTDKGLERAPEQAVENVRRECARSRGLELQSGMKSTATHAVQGPLPTPSTSDAMDAPRVDLSSTGPMIPSMLACSKRGADVFPRQFTMHEMQNAGARLQNIERAREACLQRMEHRKSLESYENIDSAQSSRETILRGDLRSKQLSWLRDAEKAVDDEVVEHATIYHLEVLQVGNRRQSFGHQHGQWI